MEESLKQLIMKGKVSKTSIFTKTMIACIHEHDILKRTVPFMCDDPQILTDYLELFNPEEVAANEHAIHILNDGKYVKANMNNAKFMYALTNNKRAAHLFADGKLKPYIGTYMNTNPDMLEIMVRMDYIRAPEDNLQRMLSSVSLMHSLYDIQKDPEYQLYGIVEDKNMKVLVDKLINASKNIEICEAIANRKEYDYLWVHRVNDLTESSVKLINKGCTRKEILALINNHRRIKSKKIISAL